MKAEPEPTMESVVIKFMTGLPVIHHFRKVCGYNVCEEIMGNFDNWYRCWYGAQSFTPDRSDSRDMAYSESDSARKSYGSYEFMPLNIPETSVCTPFDGYFLDANVLIGVLNPGGLPADIFYSAIKLALLHGPLYINTTVKDQIDWAKIQLENKGAKDDFLSGIPIIIVPVNNTTRESAGALCDAVKGNLTSPRKIDSLRADCIIAKHANELNHRVVTTDVKDFFKRISGHLTFYMLYAQEKQGG
jgi:predicted nucleic acid-binding protein